MTMVVSVIVNEDDSTANGNGANDTNNDGTYSDKHGPVMATMIVRYE